MVSAANSMRHYSRENYTVLIPNNLNNYQTEWLNICGINHKNISKAYYGKNTLIEAGELIVPLTLYSPFEFQPDLQALKKFRNLVIKKTKTAKLPSDLPKKIYISRGDANKPRGIQNEAAFERKLRRHGFIIVKLSECSVLEQINLFKSADIIVAAHGAGLSNIIFAKETCIIIEINQANYFNMCFSVMHSALQLQGSYNHYIAPYSDPTNKNAGSYHLQKTNANHSKLIEFIMSRDF